MSQEQRQTVKTIIDAALKIGILLLCFFAAQTFYDIKQSINKADDKMDKLSNDLKNVSDRLIRVETKLEK